MMPPTKRDCLRKMRKIKIIHRLLSLLLLFALISCVNKSNSRKKTAPAQETAEFTATIDSSYATKDGMYLGGYVVNIDYYEVRKLHGKKVRITGKVTIEKGLNENDTIERQGRSGDTRHIESPVIEVVAD